MVEQNYSAGGNDERDLTCGNPECGCMRNKNSLSPMEMDVVTMVLPILKATAQEEKP